MVKRYRHFRTHPYFFKDVLDNDLVIKVFHLGAFADSIGVFPADLHGVLAAEDPDRRSRRRHSCKNWVYAFPEEFDMAVERGTHQYVVYGRYQETPPTQEQLDNPSEKLVRPSIDRIKKYRLWAVDPWGLLYVVWGVRAFAQAFNICPSSINRLRRRGNSMTRDWFVPRGTRAKTSRELLYHREVLIPAVGARGYEQAFKPVYRTISDSKEHRKWHIVGVGKLFEVAKSGEEFATLIHGEYFPRKPPEEDLQRLGVSWEELFYPPAWKFFELGAKTSGKVD